MPDTIQLTREQADELYKFFCEVGHRDSELREALFIAKRDQDGDVLIIDCAESCGVDKNAKLVAAIAEHRAEAQRLSALWLEPAARDDTRVVLEQVREEIKSLRDVRTEGETSDHYCNCIRIVDRAIVQFAAAPAPGTVTVDAVVEALEAAEQCMADFVEVYERHASYVTLNEAARSLKLDGLRQVRHALKEHRTAHQHSPQQIVPRDAPTSRP